MKIQVAAIVNSLEEGALSEAAALAQLQEVTGRAVSADWLRNYWRSESLEEFVDRVCEPPIDHWQQLTDEEALGLIAEYIKASPGRRDSIGTALDRRFGKPLGTLMDLVFQRDLSEPAAILTELKKDTRIYL